MRFLLLAVALACCSGDTLAAALREKVGGSEVRVWSEPYPLLSGRTVFQAALLERLERQGYERVSRRPAEPGQFFFGHEVFWIYKRAHRVGGRSRDAGLIGLELRRRDGMILGGLTAERDPVLLEGRQPYRLEPELLSESLDDDRARRSPLVLDSLPQHVWRAVLAAEDARFFDHGGIDARSVGRAALANLKAGKVVQGGSTITQQLIKNRDLSPERTFGRKVTEAMRALALEAEFDKREILEAYLDQVYLGHVSGLAIHGFGTAARVFFSKEAAELSLAESATLAGMIQGPNRLSPIRHPERVRERRDWVLSRIAELGWAEAGAIAAARRSPLSLRRSAPTRAAPGYFLSWVSKRIAEEAPRHAESGRGVVVETTLDPWLQELAERSVREGLQTMRESYPRLRDAGLSAAFVALDATSGAVLAYVGGDPADGNDEFDRARVARRQPGSTIKPLVLLEAFESCGTRDPLHPASRVADEPLRVELPSGDWSPVNHDDRFKGVLPVRVALAESRNVPFVRIARWCGMGPTARRLERAGLPLPDEPPPSFVLGAIETSPLELAAAYTVFGTAGERVRPMPVRRIERPGGRTLANLGPGDRRVVRASTAYLVRDLMIDAVEDGTAGVVALEGHDVAAKTGTSSELRDAWLVGQSGSIVAVAWVGLDGGGRLGLTGSTAAGPIWRAFMKAALETRPPHAPKRPRGIVELYIDAETGLLVRSINPRARKELFRRVARPRRDRFWRTDKPVPVVR
jgi:penicillin-binding protein 1B